jgi:arginase family enzyme
VTQPPAGPPDGRTVPRFAGADVVEVSPPYDHAELTALAAANVAYEMLSLFARGSR